MNLAEQLNLSCTCRTLDATRLRESLPASMAQSHPHLFSETVVFIDTPTRNAIAQAVAALDRVTRLPGYQQAVEERAHGANALAPDFGPSGVFMGYDFHLGENGPRLIEINTNAGGGLLNAALAQAQFACCEEVAAILPGVHPAPTLEQDFVDMFREEWRAERGAAPLARIAIVDEQPPSQFLYPEFLLFRKLFERHGLAAVVCDPAELRFEAGALWHGGARIDLVYNRLTDFGLEAPGNAALRQAWLAGAVVLTPHPRAHALFADKRNLALLTDAATLIELGVDDATRATLLGGIPRTRRVRREEADDLWARRKQAFFKPAAGYGSKAAYRGDKLTKRVFEEILEGDYVVQDLVPPSARRIGTEVAPVELKIDLRNYAYRGRVQLVTARLYQGQTTNFRTPGGGFAPVLTVPRMEEEK